MRGLFVQRLAIPDTALHELWPIGDDWDGIGSLRQQGPQVGVMPTEFMAGAVPVFANAHPQTLDFRHQLFARHLAKVIIHAAIVPRRKLPR